MRRHIKIYVITQSLLCAYVNSAVTKDGKQIFTVPQSGWPYDISSEVEGNGQSVLIDANDMSHPVILPGVDSLTDSGLGEGSSQTIDDLSLDSDEYQEIKKRSTLSLPNEGSRLELPQIRKALSLDTGQNTILRDRHRVRNAPLPFGTPGRWSICEGRPKSSESASRQRIYEPTIILNERLHSFYRKQNSQSTDSLDGDSNSSSDVDFSDGDYDGGSSSSSDSVNTIRRVTPQVFKEETESVVPIEVRSTPPKEIVGLKDRMELTTQASSGSCTSSDGTSAVRVKDKQGWQQHIKQLFVNAIPKKWRASNKSIQDPPLVQSTPALVANIDPMYVVDSPRRRKHTSNSSSEQSTKSQRSIWKQLKSRVVKSKGVQWLSKRLKGTPRCLRGNKEEEDNVNIDLG